MHPLGMRVAPRPGDAARLVDQDVPQLTQLDRLAVDRHLVVATDLLARKVDHFAIHRHGARARIARRRRAASRPRREPDRPPGSSPAHVPPPLGVGQQARADVPRHRRPRARTPSSGGNLDSERKPEQLEKALAGAVQDRRCRACRRDPPVPPDRAPPETSAPTRKTRRAPRLPRRASPAADTPRREGLHQRRRELVGRSAPVKRRTSSAQSSATTNVYPPATSCRHSPCRTPSYSAAQRGKRVGDLVLGALAGRCQSRERQGREDMNRSASRRRASVCMRETVGGTVQA